MALSRLESTSQGPSAEAAMFSDKKAFHNLMKNETKKDWVDLMLIIINKALADETMDTYRNNLKDVLLDDCLNFLSEVTTIYSSSYIC